MAVALPLPLGALHACLRLLFTRLRADSAAARLRFNPGYSKDGSGRLTFSTCVTRVGLLNTALESSAESIKEPPFIQPQLPLRRLVI